MMTTRQPPHRLRGYPATTARPVWRSGPRGVGVVIPFRRYDAGLEEAVASVWAQSGVEAEAILVAVGVSERDHLRAERLAAKGRGRIASAATSGAALAHGTAASGAPVLTTLDPETTLAPHKLAADVDIIGTDPRAIAVCDLERRQLGAPVRWSFGALGGLAGGALTAAVAARGPALPRHIAFSRALYGRTMGYGPTLGRFADWSLAIELSGLASGVVRTPQVGLVWTPRPGRTPACEAMWDAALDLHRAFLCQADMLATRFGAEALTFLRSAAETLVVSAPMRDAWDHLEARATFPGHVLTDLRALGRALDTTCGPAQVRLERAYAALTVPA
ncbi:hypothetical protein [Acuticoccus sp. I52.16.1]|uniref:hypothetical protein n=1 Tax=Acuticoccus sp. I52.16.1 TaxID=2928472 RepID=UPI001FD4914A|nr:hypothetical protein [Acuticoccus sp. I52.16.1]UOM35185.1 hypothetical protein MRB58_02945 [Acuticoccus sp. I52.16.1]